MSDAFWTGIIAASATLFTSLLTQYLTSRQANKQADRAEKKEALQWERSEALRREELERNSTQEERARERAENKRRMEQQETRLHELWAHVMTVRWQVLDAAEYLATKDRVADKTPQLSAVDLPAHAAGLAYSVALIGLPTVRPSAKKFFDATVRVQTELTQRNGYISDGVIDEWQRAYDGLDQAAAELADKILLSNG